MLNPRRDSHMIEKSLTNRSASRRDWSQLPSSPPGSIRVIHIFAPKVIQTDVANFRALVQKLTGKSKRGGSSSKKRALKSRSMTTSDATMSSSTDTARNQSSGAAETCSESSTRSSNSASHAGESNNTVAKPGAVFSSPDSSITANTRFSGVHLSLVSSSSNQLLPELAAAFVRSQSCTASSNPRTGDSSQSSVMVDPLQNLSGYNDNRSSLQANSFSFNLSGYQAEQQQSHSHGRYGLYNMNASGFSDMDILTGLVKPGPLPEFAPPPLNNNSTPTPEHFLLSNNPSVCRLSVQSLLRGSVSPFHQF